MEVTKWLKPSDSVSRIYGDSANVQAVTRVNAEQALYGAFEVKHLFHGILHFLHSSFFVRLGIPFLRPDPQYCKAGARRSCQGWPSPQPCGVLRPCQATPCRVGRGVATPTPHRTGCADFQLPVLHGRASLAVVSMTLSVTRWQRKSRRCPIVSVLASSAIRCRFVHRFVRPKVLSHVARQRFSPRGAPHPSAGSR
jgi:hypothetical protein